MKRRTLTYTPLAVKPFSHHAPLDDSLSQFVVNNVMSAAAAAPVAASSTMGGRTKKKRKDFARTVTQKKEERRERRATNAMVGSVIRCRHGGDDVDEEEILPDHHYESTKENNSRDDEKIPPVDDDTHEENSVIGDHNEEKMPSKTDNMEDSDATVSIDDVDDHFDVGVIDNDVLLQSDDDDDAESNASAMNGGVGALRGGDDYSSDSDESSTLEGKQLFRSSSSKKKQRMVIHEEEEDDESKILEEEDGAKRGSDRHSKTTPKYAPRNTGHGGVGESTTVRRSNRLGSSPANTLINPDNKYSTDEDSDNEFTLSVTVRDNRKRNVTASKLDKKRGSSKRSKISKIEHVDNEAISIDNVDNGLSEPHEATTSARRGDRSKDRVPNTNSSLGSKASHLVDADLKRKKVVNAPLLKKSTSKVNRFVAQAEAKIAAGEAAEASSIVVTTGDNKVQGVKAKKTARNKKEDRDLFENETTAGDDDDEASEYQPTQVELTIVERSPRPSRSSSRLLKGAAKKDDVDRSLVAPTGITGGRTKSLQKSGTELSNSDHVKSMKGGRRKKMKSSNTSDKWEKKDSLDYCDNDDVYVGGNRKSKSLFKVNDADRRAKLIVGNDVTSDVNGGNVNNRHDSSINISNAGYTDLEVEYQSEDEHDGSVSVLDKSVFTQAATSQYMQQSMDSSTMNSNGGSYKPFIEEDADDATGQGTKVNKILKSIEMNTRRPVLRRSNVNMTPSCMKSTTAVANEVMNETVADNDVTSCVELTTRGISNVDSVSLLAKFHSNSDSSRSQEHSSATTTVSPDTKALLSAGGGSDDKNNKKKSNNTNNKDALMKALDEHIAQIALHTAEVEKIMTLMKQAD